MRELSSAPWEQQPGESSRAFGAFWAYRDLGPRRSLRAAVEAFCGRAAAALERQLDKWSRAFGWVDRAGAWDRHLDAQARRAQEQARRDMAERQVREAQALQAKALERLRALRPEELRPADVLRFFDDSALCALDAESGQQAAELAGQFEPSVFADYARQVARWFNRAGVLVERTNHGHAVLLWLRDNGRGIQPLPGHDGKPGWLSSALGKTQLYDRCADGFKNGEVTVHSFATQAQLASIDGSTLRAPDGLPDDRADAFALACAPRTARKRQFWMRYGGEVFRC
jgi:hypothetical protein